MAVTDVSSVSYIGIDDDAAGSIADITEYVRSIRWPRTQAVEEITGLDTTSRDFTITLKDGDVITLELIWNDKATTGFATIFGGGSLGETRSFEFGPEGNTTGDEKISCETIIANIERGHTTGTLVTATVQLQVTGAVTEAAF